MPRFVIIALAYVSASLVATVGVGIGMLIDDGEGRSVSFASAGGFLLRMGPLIAAAAALTAVPAILYAEGRSVRAYGYYVLAGILAGLAPIVMLLLFIGSAPPSDWAVVARASAIFAAAGCAAGSVYWAIAGRHAGAWGSPSPFRSPEG